MSIRDETEFVLTAFQEANSGAANDRITYWLTKSNDEQLLWLIHVCKKLIVLAEGTYMKRSIKAVRE